MGAQWESCRRISSIGVEISSAPEPVTVESVPDLPLTGEDALATDTAPKPRAGRKRAGSDESKPRRARKTAAPAGEGAEGEKPAATKRARKSRSKTASE
jgi:hypothetical protein